MTMIRKMALLGLVAPALSISATYAVEPGFYVGGSYGQTNVDVDAGDFGYSGEHKHDFKIDGDDTGWKAYLGYNFTRWLGIEAGYVDFGGISDKFRGENFDLDLTGWDGFLVGTLPLGPVDLFAKAGAINFKPDLNYGGISEDDNEVEFAYGVGLAYNIGHWSLRAEAEGFEDNEVDDFYFLSAGVTYRFGGGKREEPVVAAAPVPMPEPVEQCPDADSDGVCDADDICPDTHSGARVGAIGCNCDYVLALEFGFDSAELTANDRAQLDEMVPILINPRANNMRATIDGYTDSTGPEAYNLKLSQRRAEAVANYLASEGVSVRDHFTTNGYGEANPVASNDTAEGRAQNRRIELRRTDCGN
jgi:outer membrane protein OmpA-like peptidoglycan-associated protein